MANDKIRERIRKLLAVARDKGAFSAEAATALEMATRAMAEHGLTEAEIRAEAEAPVARDTISAHYQWELILTRAVEALYGVYRTQGQGYVEGAEGRRRMVTFYGPADVVDAARFTYDWLHGQIVDYYKAARKSAPHANENWKRDFQRAAAYKVVERAQALVKNMKVQASDGRSLVVSDTTKALSLRTKERVFGDQKMGKARSTVTNFNYGDAVAMGKRAGESVQLNQGMAHAQQAATKLIGRG